MGKLSHIVKAIEAVEKRKADMLMGGTATGAALLGNPQEAEAGAIGLANDLRKAAVKANLNPDLITVEPNGMIKYPEEFINPLSDVGAGGVRRDVAVHNDAVLGTDTKSLYDEQTLYHGTGDDSIKEFDSSYHGSISSGAGVGNWLTRSKMYASEYRQNAEAKTGLDGAILELKITKDNPMKVTFNNRSEPIIDGEVFEDITDNYGIIKLAKSRGYNSIDFVDGSFTDAPSVVRLNNKGIRKIDAAFDPQFKDSSNLLGQATTKQMAVAGGAGATALAAQAFIEKRKTRPNSVLNKAKYAASYIGEPLAAIATGTVQDIGAGLAGLAALPLGADVAEKQIGKARLGIPTYEVKGEGGNAALGALGNMFELGADTYRKYADQLGFDPVKNFEKSQELLHERGYNAPAAILKALPEIL